MSTRNAYDVFVLLDHAMDLAVEDRSVDRWLLKLTATMYLASEFAYGAPESSPELPRTVRESVSRAAELTGRWDVSQLSTVGQLLHTFVAQLTSEMTR